METASIIAIIVILVVVYLSQQPYFGGFGKTLVSDATNKAQAVLTKGYNSAMSAIMPKISNPIHNGGEVIQNGVNGVKQKISDTQKNIQNYFSGIQNAVEGKSNSSCPTQTPTN